MKTTKKKPHRYYWRPFEEARSFVIGLELKSKDAWIAWAKSDVRPIDIPANPAGAYKSKGWTNWGDWLGTKSIATFDRSYLPFNEARVFARSLGLQKKEDWSTWAKTDARPDNIPASPRSTYKNKGWISWGDWLATKNRKGNYRSFEEARLFVHTLGLKNMTEWKIWIKSDARPDDIPANPYAIYENKGWVSIGEWLGTGRIAPQNRMYRSFGEARKFVHGLGLQSQNSWNI